MTAATRAIQRIREEMQTREITQRDLALRLHCSQGRIAKILTGGVNLRVDDLAMLSEAVGISLCEVVRDRGLEFYAEMTPLEVRMLERLRRRPETVAALLTLLDIRDVPQTVTPKRKVGRPLTSSLRKSP